jgi:hypothetical protein
MAGLVSELLAPSTYVIRPMELLAFPLPFCPCHLLDLDTAEGVKSPELTHPDPINKQ